MIYVVVGRQVVVLEDFVMNPIVASLTPTNILISILLIVDGMTIPQGKALLVVPSNLGSRAERWTLQRSSVL